MPGRVEVIAEIGASHEGDVEQALRLAAAAAKAGADVVKGQIGISELCAPSSPLFERFQALELGDEAWARVAKECANLGVQFSASVWSPRAAEVLRGLGAPWVKVGSGDATWVPTLEAARSTGLPVYLAVGGCTEHEVSAAAGVLAGSLGALFACTVAYPCPAQEARLGRMRRLGGRAPKVGYSSHVADWRVPYHAAQLGAEVLEVHLALGDREAAEQGGLNPDELEGLCDRIRDGMVEKLDPALRWTLLGTSTELGPLECEEKWLKVARRDPATGRRA